MFASEMSFIRYLQVKRAVVCPQQRVKAEQHLAPQQLQNSRQAMPVSWGFYIKVLQRTSPKPRNVRWGCQWWSLVRASPGCRHPLCPDAGPTLCPHHLLACITPAPPVGIMLWYGGGHKWIHCTCDVKTEDRISSEVTCDHGRMSSSKDRTQRLSANRMMSSTGAAAALLIWAALLPWGPQGVHWPQCSCYSLPQHPVCHPVLYPG